MVNWNQTESFVSFFLQSWGGRIQGYFYDRPNDNRGSFINSGLSFSRTGKSETYNHPRLIIPAPLNLKPIQVFHSSVEPYSFLKFLFRYIPYISTNAVTAPLISRIPDNFILDQFLVSFQLILICASVSPFPYVIDKFITDQENIQYIY